MTTQFRRTLDSAAAGTAVATVGTPERYAKVREWAENASRRLVLQALADMAYAAIERAIAAAYEEMPGAGRINVHLDGRVRITLPWSKHTDEWPLNRDQRELVRALLFDAARQHLKGAAPGPTFFFDESSRRWRVDLVLYPSMTATLPWLDWARRNWTPATIARAQEWLLSHSPDGRKRGARVGGKVGRDRALG